MSLVDRLVTNEPELTPLLRSYVLDGALSVAELQSLAALRPVYVEMDVRVTRDMMDLLVPARHLDLGAPVDQMDTLGAEGCRAHIEAAEPTHPSLIDTHHLLA